ncbi:MAG TPA: prepilin-type N-terminal cleavage/methylation domain-containing protein [Candidatus Polarisedimenticolia bacterium]|nr:prepilin-type N-terminal cleavage/methylation domain-containing protein [Candidatus Polarisedimenticolia bacterium]
MSPRHAEEGFSLLELLVSLALFSMAMGGVAGLLIQNSQINRATQVSAEVQANARNCLSMIVAVLRTAGWDPRNTGLSAVSLDPTPSNSANYIEVYADLNEDGDTDDADEDVTIRWTGTQISWRKSSDTSKPFVVLADGISNDADGDGNAETMFVPDSSTHPTRITVRITARSPTPDPRSGQYIRYTVSSDVVLRRNL